MTHNDGPTDETVEPPWREQRRKQNLRQRLATITTVALCAEIARRHPTKDVGLACARVVRNAPEFAQETGQTSRGGTSDD